MVLEPGLLLSRQWPNRSGKMLLGCKIFSEGRGKKQTEVINRRKRYHGDEDGGAKSCFEKFFKRIHCRC